MKKSLMAMFYILVMLGSGTAFAAEDNEASTTHASAKYVDVQTLTDEGCG